MLQLGKQRACQPWLLFGAQSRVILIDRIFLEEAGVDIHKVCILGSFPLILYC